MKQTEVGGQATSVLKVNQTNFQAAHFNDLFNLGLPADALM